MAILTVNLLGAFEASISNQSFIKFRTNKVQALLIFLVTESILSPNRQISHRRESLMELFWPESSLKSAQDNLRQTLYQLRKALPEIKSKNQAGNAPFLITSHQSIAINPECEIKLDLEMFLRLLKGQPSLLQLEEAAEKYRGDFLENFFLPECNEFENWSNNHRAKYRRQILATLSTLAEAYIQQGNFSTAQKFARRQIEIDDLDEEAHRQLLRALAFDQNRNAAIAHFDKLTLLLNRELGIEPSDETTRLYEQIRSQNLVLSSDRITISEPPPTPTKFDLNQESNLQIEETPVFVARENELERLHYFLEQSGNGQGRVVFITGSAGMGKTSIMRELAQQAMDKYPDLLVALGNCNAYAGIGDPYLPFREIITMLLGDVGPTGVAGIVSIDHAQRIWSSLPLTIDALVENGQHMIDIFVSGDALVSRAKAFAGNDSPWYQRLVISVENQKTRFGHLEQSQLFNQFSNTLHAISANRPLLLILDDVQWADTASISLLFHLGRRLTGDHILILCAYRQDEVTLGRDGDRHPLEKILAELKRQYGDVWIDLSKIDESENRRFVDALLETAPNLLGRHFRTSLFEHTQGHPLFTVELLRAMEDRGDLIKDENGRWIQGPKLDWKTLPARVEATIGERINRLSDDLREVLTIASVEGEDFTAQVIGHVHGLKERNILRMLSQQLEKQHHLVKDQGEKQVGNLRLVRYKFSHVLIQQYLYNTLSVGERRLIHKDVANGLEKMYQGREEEIAVQLVRHYTGDPIRERYYSRLAGERAAQQYANDEAVNFLSRALELTPEKEDEEKFHLLLIREEVFDTLGDRKNQKNDLDSLQKIVDSNSDSDFDTMSRRAKLALRMANYAQNTSDFVGAVEVTKQAVTIAKSINEKSILAAGHLQWGESLWRLADFSGAQIQLHTALTIAEEIGIQQIEADSMRLLGNICYYQGDYTGAIEYQGPSLFISREIGDRSSEASALSNLGEAFRSQGDYSRAKNYYEQRLRICREIGERLGENIALNNLSLVSHNLGENERASDYAASALEIAEEIGSRSFQGYNLTNLGHSLVALGKLEEASSAYRKAADLRRDIGEEHLAIESIAGLAETYQAQGNLSEAQNQIEIILNFLESGTLDGTEEPLRIYLTCYHILKNSDPDQAYNIINIAHHNLQEQAKKIVKKEFRRMFSENVRVNREIIVEWQKINL